MEENGTNKRRKGTIKKVDKDRFAEVITLYFGGGHSQEECGKMLGVSCHTFNKWGTMFWENDYKLEGLDFLVDGLDKAKEKAWRDKRNATRRRRYRELHPKKEKDGK